MELRPFGKLGKHNDIKSCLGAYRNRSLVGFFFNDENKNKESDERRLEDDVRISSKVDEVQDEK